MIDYIILIWCVSCGSIVACLLLTILFLLYQYPSTAQELGDCCVLPCSCLIRVIYIIWMSLRWEFWYERSRSLSLCEGCFLAWLTHEWALRYALRSFTQAAQNAERSWRTTSQPWVNNLLQLWYFLLWSLPSRSFSILGKSITPCTVICSQIWICSHIQYARLQA